MVRQTVFYSRPLVCSAAAMWHWFTAVVTPVGPWLSVDPIQINIGTIPRGDSRSITFEAINRNPRQPVIVFGSTQMCGPYGCVVDSNIPLTVPPGGKAKMQFVFRAGTHPSVEYPLAIYTNAPGQTQVPLKIIGKTSPPVAPETD